MSKLSSVRQREMQAVIRERGHCTIAELSERFGVSVPTVHRDVNSLVAANEVRKVHGGVEHAPSSAVDMSWNSSFEVRVNRHRERKREIARRAFAFLEPEDVVFLDSSTTSLYLAREIQRGETGRLTVVTNSGCIVSEFHRFPRQMSLISIGGVYNAQLNAFLGGIARQAVEGLRIRTVFLSAVGVSSGGLFTFHEDHASFLGGLVSRSTRSILLADSSKFGREGLFRICGLGDLSAAVTDRGVPSQCQDWFSNAGCAFAGGEG